MSVGYNIRDYYLTLDVIEENHDKRLCAFYLLVNSIIRSFLLGLIIDLC